MGKLYKRRATYASYLWQGLSRPDLFQSHPFRCACPSKAWVSRRSAVKFVSGGVYYFVIILITVYDTYRTPPRRSVARWHRNLVPGRLCLKSAYIASKGATRTATPTRSNMSATMFLFTYLEHVSMFSYRTAHCHESLPKLLYYCYCCCYTGIPGMI